MIKQNIYLTKYKASWGYVVQHLRHGLYAIAWYNFV